MPKLLKAVKSPDRLASIDALRGLAALGVFAFHVSGVCGFPKRTLPPFEIFGRTLSNIPSVLSLGASGVSLFFVISGFCLMLQASKNSSRPFSISEYARNRFARIVPAYWFAIGLSAVIVYMNTLAFPWTDLGLHAFFLHGFVQQYNFGLNGALWSMATEVQFYLAFPLLLAAFQTDNRKLRFLAVAAVGTVLFRIGCTVIPGSTAVSGGTTRSAFLMNLLPGRLFEFLIGMGIAHAYVNKTEDLRSRVTWAVLLIAVALGLCARAVGPTYLADVGTGVMYGATVAFVVTRADFHLSSDALMAKFGRASYSFFLLHLPIVNAVAQYLPLKSTANPYLRFVAVGAVAFAISTIASAVVYLGVELTCWNRLRCRSTFRPQHLATSA